MSDSTRKPTRQRKTTAASAASTSTARETAATVLTEPFLPTLDLLHMDSNTFELLSEEDREEVLRSKALDVSHFYLGLNTLGQTLDVARELAPAVTAIPKEVRGQVVQPNGESVERLSVEPALSDGVVLGRGVLTGPDGVFSLPLPVLNEGQKARVRREGLGLRIRGGNSSQLVIRHLPPAGGSALGTVALEDELTPLPRSLVDSLVDLVSGLGDLEDPAADTAPASPVQVKLGQDACSLVFEEDTAVRRFGYKVLVRLVEPRTSTVTRVAMSRRARGAVLNTARSSKWLAALKIESTKYVDRVPIDQPIGVDRFRDGIIGLAGANISSEQRVPVAGTLGLGYVLDLAQVWKYKGLTLGNLVYSLPLAPGEQQRIAVSERVSTASVRDTEVLDISERQRSALREDASANSVFESAFEEHVTASSHYSNEARSSSWGVAGGIGAVLGPVVLGVGAGGGGGKSSNKGSTSSALDGVRTATNRASEDMHRSVEAEASGRRRSSRTSIRLARETDTQTITTKVITNHNKAHALTIQYWEVLRKFISTTEVEGTTLVCFVPLEIVRFLPAGQPLQITQTSVVADRVSLLRRYALLQRHADAIQPWLPARHREGMRLLDDFASNPRAEVEIDGSPLDTLDFSLSGTFIPHESVWVTVLLRGGRRLARVPLSSSLGDLPKDEFGSEGALVSELQRRRNDDSTLAVMKGTVALPPTADRGDIVGFEISRAFRPLNYQLAPAKNSMVELLKESDNQKLGAFIGSVEFKLDVNLAPAQLERLLGGPRVTGFEVSLNGSSESIAADSIPSLTHLLPNPMLIPALEQHSPLWYRDLLKIERTLQHVVRNTLTYSKAVWSSLTAEERVVMLEAFTIGLPETGLDADGLNDASQHIPLLNCVSNQVLGYYGNCMILPFSIPAALAVALAGESSEPGAEREDREDASAEIPTTLTSGAVQDALTAFHKAAFSPPVSHFTLPTRGVLGEAVLGNCPSAEKIDLTRFWNWQDSPGDEATAIQGVQMRDSTVAQLTAPAALTQVPSVINIVPGQGGTLTPGTLTAALAANAAGQSSFSTDFLGHDVLKTLGEKTIASAESARADALGKATQLASQAMTAAVEVHKTEFESEKAKKEKEEKEKKEAEEKKAAEEKATAAKVDAAVKNLKDNAKSYLAAANAKPDAAAADALTALVLKELGTTQVPLAKAITLFDAFDQKEGDNRTQGSTAWLKALGLVTA